MIFANMVGKKFEILKIRQNHTSSWEIFESDCQIFKTACHVEEKKFYKRKKKSVFGDHGGIERNSPFLGNHFEKEGSKYTFKYGKSKFFDG